MNRQDALDTIRYLAQLHAATKIVYDNDATSAAQKNRAGKDMDKLAALYKALKPGPVKAVKPTNTVKAGVCVCGEDIKIGARYSVALEGSTTIKRVCTAYRCKRVNEVELTVTKKTHRTDWKVTECDCGTTVYLRNDYGGGAGFGLPDGPGFFGGMISESDYRNRTVKHECRTCGCKRAVKVRFFKAKGEGNYTRSLSATVRLCRDCQDIQAARKEA